jgi:hypothetical protein
MSDYTMPPPTPSEEAGDVLAGWIYDHPDANKCGVAILRERPGVVVYWKGTPPVGLQRLAAEQPVPVTFRQADYSLEELDPIARSVVADNPGVVSSAGPIRDYSGVGVTLWSKAPPTAMAMLRAKYPVPIRFERYSDPMPLVGR